MKKRKLKSVLQKKQLKAVLDITPSSEEVIQNLQEDRASPRKQPCSPQQVNVPAINSTPKTRDISTNIITNGEDQWDGQPRTKKTKKRLKQLEMMAKRKQVIVNIEGRGQKITTKRGHQRTWPNSQRRLMRTLVSRFLHQDEVFTVSVALLSVYEAGLHQIRVAVQLLFEWGSLLCVTHFSCSSFSETQQGSVNSMDGQPP